MKLTFWDTGNPYGQNWMFRNVELEPTPENIQAKQLTINELKALPSSNQFPTFPGGTDFVTLSAKRRKLFGGNTFYEPKLQ